MLLLHSLHFIVEPLMSACHSYLNLYSTSLYLFWPLSNLSSSSNVLTTLFYCFLSFPFANPFSFISVLEYSLAIST